MRSIPTSCRCAVADCSHQSNSQPDDIVLLEPYQEMSAKYAILHREIPRPTLVSWKFVPSNRVEILRWYALIRARDQLFVGGCGGGIALEPKPALLVTFTADSAQRIGDCGPGGLEQRHRAVDQGCEVTPPCRSSEPEACGPA